MGYPYQEILRPALTVLRVVAMILKVQQKQRLFIYSRKEMVVLVLLGSLIAVFAFTLGIHLGKRVAPSGEGSHAAVTAMEAASEEVPSGQQLSDEADAIREASDESLDQAAHDEVEKAGLKLDTPRQVELPKTPKSDGAGATTTAQGKPSEAHAPSAAASGNELQGIPAALRPAPAGKYTLQIGSFKTAKEAGDRAEVLEAAGLKPFLRAAEIKGKGRWFRLYVGGFGTRDEAEKAGGEYRSHGSISSFVIANAVE